MLRRLIPYGEAIIVVLVWAASPPLIKILLEDLSPYEVAGLRYFCAFLLFIPLLIYFSRGILRELRAQDWLRLAVMGIAGFAIGNLLMSKALENLNATTAAFLLNGIPVLTFLLGIVFLNEKPTPMQWVGLVVALAGGVIFFGIRVDLEDFYPILLTLIGVLAYTINGLVGRAIAREKVIDSLTLSAVPMGIGGFIILFISPRHAFPPISTWGILFWLIVPGSMFAFLLWNHARQKLQAFEMSITLNLMPIGTALISPWLIGETIPGRAWAGMLVTMVGVLLVGISSERITKRVIQERPL